MGPPQVPEVGKTQIGHLLKPEWDIEIGVDIVTVGPPAQHGMESLSVVVYAYIGSSKCSSLVDIEVLIKRPTSLLSPERLSISYCPR